MLSVEELFRKADINSNGPVPWRTEIAERGPGIYVVTLGSGADAGKTPECLPAVERPYWIEGQQIIYIGRSKHCAGA